MNREPTAPPRVHAFRDDALGTSDTVDLLRRIAAREVSPAELVSAAVERAHSVEDQLNAVVSWVPEPAPDPAHSDALFAGIPTAIKDNELLAGLPTTQGSRAVAARPARRNSIPVQQLVDLGFTPILKSALPEFGLTSTTESSLLGATRNPWHVGHSTGGSSGGAAALAAAGVVPIAHANDGGGSTRIPASCCGLVGLKPTRGRILDEAFYDYLPVNIVTQGVLTRSVRDTALYLAEAEKRYLNPALPPVGHVVDPVDRPLRIAVLTRGPLSVAADPVTEDTVMSVARLCQGLGHHIDEIDYPWSDRLGVDFLRYWALTAFAIKRGGARLYGKGFQPELVEAFTDELVRFFATVAPSVPGTLRRLRRFDAGYEETFVNYDVMLTPVLAHEPPPIGYLGPDVPARTQLIRLMRFMGLTPMHNVAGAPAVSLPMGMGPRGLPIGVLLAARKGQERLLLELALQLEESQPWPTLAAA